MKQFELSGLGLEEMSIQEQRQTNGGNPLVLIALCLSLFMGLCVFIHQRRNGNSLT